MTDPIPEFDESGEVELKTQRFILDQELTQFSNSIIENDELLKVIAASMGHEDALDEFKVTPNKRNGLFALQIRRYKTENHEGYDTSFSLFDHVAVGRYAETENGVKFLLETEFAGKVLGREVSKTEPPTDEEMAVLQLATRVILSAEKVFADNCEQRGLDLAIDEFGQPALRDDINNTHMFGEGTL